VNRDIRAKGLRKFAAAAGALLERAYSIAVRLSFAQLSGAIVLTALVVATGLSYLFWDILYGVNDIQIAVIAVIVTLLTAIPLTAFVVYVIKKAEHARAQLAETNTALAGERAKQVSALEALKAARDDAAAANTAKTQFIANMSHELRTPLNAILGFSELMMRETLGPVGSAKYRGYLVDIYGSGRHLLDLINDILDVARIESGNLPLHEEPLKVAGIVKSAVRLILVRAGEQQVNVADAVPEDLPLLTADARALKQMLLNLLSNAVRFTPAGGQVAVEARVDTTGDLVLSVRDTGIGMAKSDIPKAMLRFSQVDNSHTRKYQGAGLGLSLTKALVELHGGALELDSEPGVGTVASLRFPASRLRPQRHTTAAQV